MIDAMPAPAGLDRTLLRDYHGRTKMGVEFGGLLGLLVLAADIWAIVNVLQSGGSTGNKVVWVLVIVILPVLGLLVWLLAGPRGRP